VLNSSSRLGQWTKQIDADKLVFFGCYDGTKVYVDRGVVPFRFLTIFAGYNIAFDDFPPLRKIEVLLYEGHSSFDAEMSIIVMKSFQQLRNQVFREPNQVFFFMFPKKNIIKNH
jgi:hypothetical protein